MTSTLQMPTESSQYSESLARAYLAGAGSAPEASDRRNSLLQAILLQWNAGTSQPSSATQFTQSQPTNPTTACQPSKTPFMMMTHQAPHPAPISIGVRAPPPISVGTPPAGYRDTEIPSYYTTPEPTPTHSQSSRSHTPPHTESEGSVEDADHFATSCSALAATTAAAQLDPSTPLRHAWVYWASWKLETDQLGTMEDCRPIGECGTMGEFWDGFSRLLVADMPVNVSLQLLRKGVPPMYDHPENRNGGHFKIRAASMAAACTLWSQLTVAIAREQLPYADQVQGCNVVKKLRSTTLQVWVVNSLSKATVEAVRLYLLTNLPRGDYLRLKFCPHKYLLRTLQTKRAQRRGGYDDDF